MGVTGLVAFLAIIVLFVLLMDTRSRLKRAESTLQEAAKRIGALQRHAGLLPPRAEEAAPPEVPLRPEASEAASPRAAAARVSIPSLSKPVRRETPAPLSRDEPAAAQPAAPGSRPGADAGPTRSMASRFEDLFGKTLPIWLGGITLAIAGLFIVRYAIDEGFFASVFTPGVQIVTGLLFGFALIGGAEYAWRNEARLRDVRVPQALAGAGVATLYAAIMVAANVYLLIGPLFAFAALALVTASALGLSLRFGAPSAALGLAGGLAAPALVGALAPDVPLIAVYLALTIAALAGIARIRRWPWLALAALIGGAGWGLWMVLSHRALDALGSLSIGGFVLLLAIAIPMLSFEGPRAALLRTASAIVGALQLALLVGYGGFTPLHWGLFALIAAAGQWLAWRERGFAIVPTISAVLSVLLLAAWPGATPFWFALIGLALAAIHALPLLARLWGEPGAMRRALELCAIALAMPALTKWQVWGIGDAALALVALGGAALAGAGIARGWRDEGRSADGRFASLTATAGALLALATLLLVARWLAPLAIGIIAAALLFFGKVARDRRIERAAAGFVGAAILALLLPPWGFAEFPRVIEGASGAWGQAFVRWAGVAAVATLLAVRGEGPVVRRLCQFAAALLAYGACAQVALADWLMLIPALGGMAVLLAARRVALGRVDAAAVGFGFLSLGWAAWPIGAWSLAALVSLAGVPMPVEAAMLSAKQLVLRLLIPALAFGVPLWWIRRAVPRGVRIAGLGISSIAGGIAAHSLYRIGFAALAGSDFVVTGIMQRLLWEALLVGAGWIAMQRGMAWVARPLVIAATLHALVYNILLHNPLWADQAVGGWPIVNLLAPLFLLPGIGLILVQRLTPSPHALLGRGAQIVLMLLVLGFAWATLRQFFHGSLLAGPGVAPAENILRSLLILALAVGFLSWGIRAGRRDWRIASLLLMLGAVGKVFLFDASGLEGLLRIGSFVALGFSLIGIGWLYSRQLAGAASPQKE